MAFRHLGKKKNGVMAAARLIFLKCDFVELCRRGIFRKKSCNFPPRVKTKRIEKSAVHFFIDIYSDPMTHFNSQRLRIYNYCDRKERTVIGAELVVRKHFIKTS